MYFTLKCKALLQNWEEPVYAPTLSAQPLKIVGKSVYPGSCVEVLVVTCLVGSAFIQLRPEQLIPI